MEKEDGNRNGYRKEVEAYLKRRNIQEIVSTLVWLRDQKSSSYHVKKRAFENVAMNIEVLGEMIVEAGLDEEGK